MRAFDIRFSAALFPVPNVNEMSGDRSRGGYRGRHKVSPALIALATFKIAVRSRGAALPRRKLIRIHRKAHRATWLAPLKPRSFENLVETPLFRLEFSQALSGHDHGIDVRIDPFPVDDARDFAQVLDARIGA